MYIYIAYTVYTYIIIIMTTQLVIRIDQGLKNRAMDRAQKEGISLSSVLKLATKAYVEGDLEIKLTTKDELKDKMKIQLSKSLQDIKHKRNISKAFDNAEEAIRHLKML